MPIITPKSHSPEFSNVTWDKEKVLEDLKSFLLPPPLINWQKFAREHDIPERNCGQVIKNLPNSQELTHFSLTTEPQLLTLIQRREKCLVGKFQLPAPATIKGEWQKMVESGEVCPTQACVVYSKAGTAGQRSWSLAKDSLSWLKVGKSRLSSYKCVEVV